MSVQRIGKSARERRRARWHLHRWSAQNSSRPSASKCMGAIDEKVDVGVTAAGTAHVTGVGRCGSVAACPLCAPVVREKRAGQIDAMIAAAIADDCVVFMLTATMQHDSSDALDALMQGMATAWNKAWSGRRANERGYLGQVRSWDFTWGEANGWHPHFHNLLVYDLWVYDDLGNRCFKRSIRSIKAHIAEGGELFREALATWGYRSAEGDLGWHVREVRSASDTANYLTKVEGGWGAGLEVARTDVKVGKAGRRTPWQILTDAASKVDVHSAMLWVEYERATLNRRMIVMGRRLCVRFGVEIGDDVEDAAGDPSEAIVFTRSFTPKRWNKALRAGEAVTILEDVQDAAASAARALVGWLSQAG